MTIDEAQKQGLYEINNIEDARLKTRLLMAHVLGKNKEYVIIHKDIEIGQDKIDEFKKGIEKLKKGIPLAYIINYQEFMKLDFYVDENVLIPRADTEVLVESVLKQVDLKEKLNILDLCTGSGAIAISLAKYSNSNITGTDISNLALDIAKKNAKRNCTKVKFVQSNLFENVQERQWDVIVSNPPYIETEVIETLQAEVKCEPMIALDGGKDGLDFYREIITKSLLYLKDDGLLALEIGYNQANDVVELLKSALNYNKIEVIKDLGGNNRVVLARKTNSNC